MGKRVDKSTSSGFGATLGDLLRQKGLVPSSTPSAPAPTPTAPAPSARAAPTLADCPAMRVRIERKGHGGKTVTLVEGLEPLGAGIDALAGRLRKQLGCGATVVDGAIQLQGDQRERALAVLSGT